MHNEFADLLSDYRDGDLPADQRARVDAHLAGCNDCRALLADIDMLASHAATLGERQPDRDLWPGIAERIASEPRVSSTGDGVFAITIAPRARRRFSFTAPQLAAAAIVLALAAAGAARLLPSLAGPAATPAVAADDAGGAVRLAAHVEMSYEPTIRQLEALLADAEDVLDEQTVAVLRQSLATMDAAIDEARSALAADPANAFLSRHLDGTMRRKVDLLRQAGRLVART